MPQLKSEILDRNFDVKIVHVDLTVNKKDLWVHDKWAVIIEGQSFNYSTGIGHRKSKFTKKSYIGKEFTRLMRMNPKKEFENLQTYASKLEEVSLPTAPKIDDILYSLVLDSSATEYTFEEWCSDFGYDEDSRKAEGIYHACKEVARKVKTFIPNLEEAREKFQDY